MAYTYDMGFDDQKHPLGDLIEFINEKAILHEHTTLSSGQESEYYINGKLLLSDPRWLDIISEEIAFRLQRRDIQAIGGPALGSIYISTGVSLFLQLPQFTVYEGELIVGDHMLGITRVAVVDDVITTGGSLIRAIDVVEKKGWRVVLASAIVDRESGAREALEARGIDYCPLLTISEIVAYG